MWYDVIELSLDPVWSPGTQITTFGPWNMLGVTILAAQVRAAVLIHVDKDEGFVY